MDGARFDHLVQSLSAGGPRRAVLRQLAGLSLGGVVALLLGEASDAKRRKHGKDKKSTRAGAENHKHEGRRRKHHRPRRHRHKHKDKKKPCQPESAALTCDGRCGEVQNNCQQAVDCGSCACTPTCTACQVCDSVSGQCQPDSAQDGQTCGGCQVCEQGQCVPDASIVCTALDQCHEAGVCDPETGACTNPPKSDDTSCDDGDLCTTNDTCQSGACTAGATVDCSAQDDECNRGVCRPSDGACIKDPRPDGTPCGEFGQCQSSACDEPDANEVIGSATKPIPNDDACGDGNGRTCESLAGDVISDAMRLTYDTDFALMISGGIRADLTCPPGGSAVCPSGGAPNQITWGQVHSVLPFGNRAVTLELSGAELKAMLEAGVRTMPAPAPEFPQVSGLCFTYDISAAPGSRVTGAVRQAANGSCSGAAIDLSNGATHTLTTNDFTAGGGDGYPNLIARASLREVLARVVGEFVAAESPLDPHIEGRIACAGGTCPTPVGG